MSKYTVMVVIIFVAAIYYIAMPSKTMLNDFDYALFIERTNQGDGLKVAVISDFRCVGCKVAHQKILPLIEQEYSKQHIDWYYAPFPVLGTDSQIIAEQAILASRISQTPYWQVAEYVYSIITPDMTSSAIAAKLEQQYEFEFSHIAANDKQAVEDLLQITSAHINGLDIRTVPSFVVNHRLVQVNNKDALSQILAEEMALTLTTK